MDGRERWMGEREMDGREAGSMEEASPCAQTAERSPKEARELGGSAAREVGEGVVSLVSLQQIERKVAG